MTSNKDRPWIIRTYAGHSTAAASNALFRRNLGQGQTGLSVAFDLPTQTGYDSDHPLAMGEVGKVGVPICHLGDMRALFDQIPLDQMNTSMTINATAPWLLALYVALAEEQGADISGLQGTVQNDVFKEYLSRGTHIFPPEPSLKLMTDIASWTSRHVPKWNPMNVCSYHLQEAGATPVQEVAFALATAQVVLDHLHETVAPEDFPKIVGRVSFFVNAGMKFVTEICKLRAFAELWDEICETRYEIADPKLRRFRYGVQVNSLGLTEQEPENNIARILIEMLGVTLSKTARARAVQLPAWNEALGLPRPWDQQLSLRMQQLLAHETDLLEYGDLFDGSPVIEARTGELKQEIRDELDTITAMGGALKATEYLKAALVRSNADRISAIETGENIVIGVNRFTDGEKGPLTTETGLIHKVDPMAETDQKARLAEWRAQRDVGQVTAALDELRRAANEGENIMPASIAAARAGVTTGEWANALREIHGEYRAPTGVSNAPSNAIANLDPLREKVDQATRILGRKPRFLVAKPGLDGHSNGAEQIASRARDCGMDILYDGIRQTPSDIAESALAQGSDVVGLSILSGSHLEMVGAVRSQLEQVGIGHVPIVVGGIVPAEDAEQLRQSGVRKIYTPRDFDLSQIVSDIVDLSVSKVDA